MDIFNSLIHLAREYNHTPAVITSEDSLSWGDLLARVASYIEQLQQTVNHSRCAIHVQKGVDSFALLLATDQVVGEFLIMPDSYPIDVAISLASPYQPRCLLIAHEGRLQVLHQYASPSPHYASYTTICLLTSGTTGLPKCVKHTWRSLTLKIKQQAHFLGKKWCSGYPLAHFAGLQVALQSVLNGGCLLLLPDYIPKTILYLLHINHCDYFNCTPTLIRQILLHCSLENFPALSLQHITLGGETVDQATLELIKKYLPNTRVSHIYAASELGVVMHVRDGREGFPVEWLDNKQLKLMDDELYVYRNPAMMQGYLDKKATGKKWLATGDLIKVSDERALFVGRRNDVINVGGYKVYPGFVEGVMKQLPAIDDVLIVGEKNILAGYLVKALIMTKEADQDALIAQIIHHCRQKLPYYMVPTLFEFVEKITTSLMSKKLRK